MPFRAILLMLVLLGTSFPMVERARAAPCCMSATAFGVGRLLNWEDFAIGLRSSVGYGLGAWGADGRWSSWRGYTELEWRSELWGMVALDERTSVFARLPAVMMLREAGGMSDLGGGLGEMSAGLRYEIVSIGEYMELPAIALTFSALAPTGRATDASRSPLAADVTGRGAWTLSAGVSVEWTQLPWFVRLDLGVAVPLPQHRTDLGIDQRLGLSVDVILSAGWEVYEDLVLSLSPNFMWGDETRYAGLVSPDSDRRKLGLGFNASWRFDPHWTLQFSLDGPMPFDALGKNEPAHLLTSVGVRYGSF